MTQHYQNYIGGTWVRAASTRTFDDINPADRDEVLGTFPRADGCDVDLDDAVEIANATAYGLSSAIYTQDIGRAFRAIEALATGVTCVNASTIGAEAHFPFRGVSQTGNGHREGGWTVPDVMTEWKTIYIDYSPQLQRAQAS